MSGIRRQFRGVRCLSPTPTSASTRYVLHPGSCTRARRPCTDHEGMLRGTPDTMVDAGNGAAAGQWPCRILQHDHNRQPKRQGLQRAVGAWWRADLLKIEPDRLSMPLLLRSPSYGSWEVERPHSSMECCVDSGDVAGRRGRLVAQRLPPQRATWLKIQAANMMARSNAHIRRCQAPKRGLPNYPVLDIPIPHPHPHSASLAQRTR